MEIQLHVNQIILRLLCLLTLLTACGKDSPPRSRDEIFQEKAKLPTLFLTAKTEKRVVAPRSQGSFVDKDLGEICWRAFECRNTDCPGRGGNDKPYLFIIPDPAFFINPSGSLGFDTKKAKEAIKSREIKGCPKCLMIRDLKSESTAIRRRYASYIQLHVLPEATERLKELDEEYKRRVEWEEKKK